MYPVQLGGVTYLYFEEGHLAWLLEDGLGIAQRNDRPTIFKTLPCFVDADNPEGGFVQFDGVAHRCFQIIGCLPAQDDLPLARQGLAFDDLEMLDGHLVRVVAADDEVRDAFQANHVEDHARHVAHVGQLCDTLADLLIHRAQSQVAGVGLGHQQIGAAAPGERGIALGDALGHSPQGNDGCHADTDSQHRQ